MKKIISLLLLLILMILSCNTKHQNNDDSKKSDATYKEHKHHKNPSNKSMHQTPVSELIERFESPERDAYQKPEEVINYLGNLQGKTVIDIGAGSGYFSIPLADKAEEVIAADVNQEFLNHIKNRVEDNNIKNIEVRKIPYDSLDLKEKEVDMVLIVNTYHHINNRSDYFSKVKQGLTTDGELVIIDFFKTEVPVGPKVDHKFSIDEVIAELQSAGFKSFEIEVNLLPYQYIIKTKKS